MNQKSSSANHQIVFYCVFVFVQHETTWLNFKNHKNKKHLLLKHIVFMKNKMETLSETLSPLVTTDCSYTSTSMIDICFSVEALRHKTHKKCSNNEKLSDQYTLISSWTYSCFSSEMGESEERRDVFKLTRDWLSVQEVVEAVSSSSCGAVSLFIGSYFIYLQQQKYSFRS